MQLAPLPVGIDSYSLVCENLNSFQILDWTAEHGGDGVQFTSVPELGTSDNQVDSGFLRELGEHARSRKMYLEWGLASHVPFSLADGSPQPVLESIRLAAEQAEILGVSVVRSCSGGLMRWSNHLPPTEAMLEGMVAELKQALPVLQDHGVTLALETHFEFTTFELVRVFEAVGVTPGEGLGICLDTMNLLTMLENPVWATSRVLPWVVATHAKDGCIVPHPGGFRTFTTQIGLGSVDWAAIIPMLARLNPRVTLSIEDHGGAFEVPYFRPTFLSRFPDLTVQELASLQQLAVQAQERVLSGEVAPVTRQDWPSLCQSRVSADIDSLKALQDQVLGA